MLMDNILHHLGVKSEPAMEVFFWKPPENSHDMSPKKGAFQKESWK